jgi:EmrB/QacA subfamily drug resistance transporter
VTHRPLTTAAVLFGMFMAAMEATVVATAMPTVVTDLGGIQLYGWVGAAYMLAGTVTIPIYGKLADLVGRKPIMYLGLVLFLAGSMASGLAGSMIALIVWRAVQGLGAGALQPVSITIIGDLYTAEERAKIQGFTGAVWGIAAMIGPLLGALLVRTLSWRWVFYVNVPFGLLAGTILFFAFHEKIEKKEHSIDVAGAVVLSVAIVSLLLGASRVVPLFTLPIAFTLLAAFIAVETRAKEPLLPLALMRRRVIATSSAAAAMTGAIMTSTILYVPLFVQAVMGGTPTDAGTSVAPMLVGWPLASATSSRFITRLGFRPLVRTGAAVVLLSSVAIAAELHAGASLWGLRALMFAFGTGLGLQNTALLIAVQEAVPWGQRGVATASSMFFRTIGGAVAVGALGAALALALPPDVPSSVVNELLGPTHGKALDPAVSAAVASSLEVGLRTIFRLVALLATLGVVFAVMFPDEKLARREATG